MKEMRQSDKIVKNGNFFEWRRNLRISRRRSALNDQLSTRVAAISVLEYGLDGLFVLLAKIKKLDEFVFLSIALNEYHSVNTIH